MSIRSVVCATEDPRLRSILQITVNSEGHDLHMVPSPDQIASLAAAAAADIFVLDSPRTAIGSRRSVEALLPKLGAARCVVVVDSGDEAGKCLFQSLGACQVLQRPVLRHDLEKLLSALDETAPAPQGAFPQTEAELNGAYLEELDNGRFFLAASAAMREIYDNIRILAPVDVPVLILGESGVGKEIVANLLHRFSTRSANTFTNVNCAALPSELLESELFGYEVGAFTGAVKAKPGKFEISHRGTILLDEIGEMSAPMQAKLLHVLQDGQFSRLGARTSTRVNVRVLAATNINMDAAIEERRFREDLYYRLNAFAIVVPPLRERREEIPLLLKQMFRRVAAELNRPPLEPGDSLLNIAQEYHWPGNLRELRNFVTRTLVLWNEAQAVQELRTKIARRGPSGGSSTTPLPTRRGMPFAVREVKDHAESQLISEALQASNWNRRRAACNLQISYRSLLYKIQQYELVPSA